MHQEVELPLLLLIPFVGSLKANTATKFMKQIDDTEAAGLRRAGSDI